MTAKEALAGTRVVPFNSREICKNQRPGFGGLRNRANARHHMLFLPRLSYIFGGANFKTLSVWGILEYPHYWS